MSTAERELQRRRERGRQSQASFRKRQAQAAQHLTANNRQLKDAIGKIINAARTKKYPELVETIFDAAEGAGIDFERPRQFDTNNSHSKFAASGPQILPEHVEIGGSTAVDHTNSGPAFPVVPALPLVAPQQLSWGIWLDPLHYMRASLPPEDIIPYLGQGSKTFAGRLFWSVMEHSQIKCEREHSDRFTLIQRGLRHSKATQDLGSPFIQATVEARLEYKRIGSISPQYALAGEADLGVVLRDQIEKDYRSRGKDPSLWLSSLAIERRLRVMVGNVTFGLLEMAARGEGSPPLRDLMDRVKCALYETCDCFGDGPRWNVNVVDGLFLDWIAEASSL
ncbi:hypothetical protein AK830_g12203 [Neonectria ditissima]|uniref:BZIP domain-containing protein n=1 Tax=Neonectria ditissima TaxID=78410 RepID=A0A0P7AKL1_9HYPO|nr:hypothetical protein AK830_g12203 [Neonectria ditissima]